MQSTQEQLRELESTPQLTQQQQPANFDVVINKNNESDAFDQLQLLQKVPKSHLSNAKKLLKVFDDNPQEITWNNSAVLFIDDVAIPDSNICLIFPYLFEPRKDSSFDIRGLQELILKIQLMGYGNLISKRHKTIVKVDDLSSEDSDSAPWYYIGS